MRLWSIRTRTPVLAVVSASIIVSAVLAAAYVVVVDGMSGVAEQETHQLADSAMKSVRKDLDAWVAKTREEGGAGRTAAPAATQAFFRSLPGRLGLDHDSHVGNYVVWEKGADKPTFASEPLLVDDPVGRLVAERAGGQAPGHIGGNRLILNLVLTPDLGMYVEHVPFAMPDGRPMVLDVWYDAKDETDALRLIRPPMIGLSASAVLVTGLIMLWATSWVLRLVNELRVATDSVDAGLLNVTLPETRNDEVGDLARSINNLIGHLRRRADMQTRFVADASHELATPVAGIRGYVGILRSWGHDDPEVREEALRAIDRESRRMVGLTRQMLALIRSEAAMALRPSVHDINAVCRRALADTAMRYPDKNLEFEGPDDTELMITADPDRMAEVLSILVDNAAKYTPEGGSVLVRTSRRDGDVVIEVTDTGRGIPPGDVDAIFERFYRGDESRYESAGGFGLGLPIAKEIVESSGGRIEVASQLGIGTRFTVTLPLGIA